ncbi:uncharacterized protein N0V89_004423 [Didymosphaeria variabile]|uniref:Glycoside hydrolase n=1 Tax=Didymosphaeria variabile TaxID=1932322 RepID=A0A9W8XSF4_9PLEO|nr:uncharacterized protein N0V89_004423 [Didymosphaeria variabile]KAJ4356390.1 hypothetical protein N0V89_004423 [Didymosphaeria variabile]
MKMHWCTPLLALAAPVLSAPVAAPRSTAGSERAIWLWNSDIIQDDSQVQTFLSLMTNSDHPFQTVLALIDRDMGNAPWQSFIKKCNAAGLKVEALMGDKQWIVGQTSEDGPTLEHELEWIKKYQASASSDAKLAGIHLDAEYVSSLVSIVSQVKEVAQPLNLPLGADLPFWANTVECEDSTLDTCLLNNLDYVTFMTYRNTAKSLLGIADPVLKAVKAVDSSKPVWLSVETSSECSDVSLISYAGKTLNNMLSDLVTVATSAEKSSGNFAGVAVHSYKDFLTMSG